jgi:hypothetical protein
MADMSYDQKEIKVKAGGAFKHTLIDTSKDSIMQHNFVLIEKNAIQKVATKA